MTNVAPSIAVAQAPAEVLADHADRMYRDLGSTIVVVAELKSAERLQPPEDAA